MAGEATFFGNWRPILTHHQLQLHIQHGTFRLPFAQFGPVTFLHGALCVLTPLVYMIVNAGFKIVEYFAGQAFVFFIDKWTVCIVTLPLYVIQNVVFEMGENAIEFDVHLLNRGNKQKKKTHTQCCLLFWTHGRGFAVSMACLASLPATTRPPYFVFYHLTYRIIFQHFHPLRRWVWTCLAPLHTSLITHAHAKCGSCCAAASISFAVKYTVTVCILFVECVCYALNTSCVRYVCLGRAAMSKWPMVLQCAGRCRSSVMRISSVVLSISLSSFCCIRNSNLPRK